MDRALQRLLTIRQIRLISVLGRELSLSKCAEVLHTTQPAASRALAQLESLLEVRLFERTTKRITPTSAGLSLVQHANRILAEIDLAEEELHGLRGGISGEIRLGVLPVFSSAVLAKAIYKARDILPDVHIVTHTQPIEGLYEALLDGRIDLMLAHAELSVDLNQVEVTALYEEFSSIVVAPAHRLAHRRRVSWADVANAPWVLPPPNTPLRPKLDRMLSVYRRAAEPQGVNVQTDSAALAVALVRECAMLWATADRYASDYEAAGLVRKIAMPGELLRGPMCCLRLRHEVMKTPVRVFIACLREVANGEA